MGARTSNWEKDNNIVSYNLKKILHNNGNYISFYLLHTIIKRAFLLSLLLTVKRKS